jgi:cellulose synthase/poly-beta-1,6-N-acetylglucosamine synthase-like glycosyltransferase
MQLLLALATAGGLFNLAILVILGRRLRTAEGLGPVLYAIANLALLAAVAAAIDPEEAAIAAVLVVPVALATFGLAQWTAPARIFFGCLGAASLVYVAYAFSLTFLSGLGVVPMVLCVTLLFFEIGALALACVYTYEGLSVLCRARWSRRVIEAPAFDHAFVPFVSIHIPTYSEPPDLVVETLEALARLDYPSFEVVVVDNNTKDPALWRPVEIRCLELGPRFRFFHVDPLKGFKAGACNFALARSDPRTDLVAIIDADYVVEPSFLKEVTPHFRDQQIAFVQTPQDYQQYHGNRYLTDCLHAYSYFFAVSMPARNEDDASIFAGTMGLIRRSALVEIGGWDERCITEDAEASLRLLQRGYRSLYVAKSYGRGLMPFDFDSYKKQRFRWAFGGIQIFRKHWRSLVPFWPRPRGDRLTRSQRLWYLAAAFLWCGEPIQLAFAAFLVVGALSYATGLHLMARPVTEALLIFPPIFLGVALIRFLWILRSTLRLGTGAAIGAAVSMFSLSWVVAQAVLSAAVRGEGVFLRTSKAPSNATFIRALHASRWETLLAIACLAAGAATLLRGPAALGAALAILCLWQASIYGSSFVTSLSAIRSAKADRRPARYRRYRERSAGRRTAMLFPAFVGASALTVLVTLASVANAPTVVEDMNAGSAGQAPILPQAVVATPTAPPATPTPTTEPATGPLGPLRTAAPIPFATARPPAGPPSSPAAASPSSPTPAVAPPTPQQTGVGGGQPTARPTRPVSTPPPAASHRPSFPP